MPLIEAWWGNWNCPGGLEVKQTGSVYSIRTHSNDPSTLTWRYYVSPDRMTQPDGPCLSAPTLLPTGRLSARVGLEPWIGPNPRVALEFTLAHRVFVEDLPAGSGALKQKLIDVQGSEPSEAVVLGPMAFPPLVFPAKRGKEIRIELDLVVNRHRHGDANFPSHTWPEFEVRVPQWGMVFLEPK